MATRRRSTRCTALPGIRPELITVGHPDRPRGGPCDMKPNSDRHPAQPWHPCASIATRAVSTLLHPPSLSITIRSCRLCRLRRLRRTGGIAVQPCLKRNGRIEARVHEDADLLAGLGEFDSDHDRIGTHGPTRCCQPTRSVVFLTAFQYWLSSPYPLLYPYFFDGKLCANPG